MYAFGNWSFLETFFLCFSLKIISRPKKHQKNVALNFSENYHVQPYKMNINFRDLKIHLRNNIRRFDSGRLLKAILYLIPLFNVIHVAELVSPEHWTENCPSLMYAIATLASDFLMPILICLLFVFMSAEFKEKRARICCSYKERVIMRAFESVGRALHVA